MKDIKDKVVGLISSNNKSRLIIVSVLSICLVLMLLIGSTYSIFVTSNIDEELNVYQTGVLDVTYKLSDANINFTDYTPTTIEESKNLKPYTIRVKNVGKVDYKFNLILSDTTATDKINYAYIMTQVGKLEPKSLSDCNNNIIKSNIVVPAGQEVVIDVRVWISDDVSNSEMGKSFYSKLSIEGLAVYNDNDDIDNTSLRAYNFLADAEPGSYVAYTGDNGCEGAACNGQNYRYASDSNMGYCNSADYKFTTNGWRIGYVKEGSAHLVAAGSPECLCTASNGTTSNTAKCSSSLATANIAKHVDNLNEAALDYCNSDYAYNGVCTSNTTWALNVTDFQNITGKAITSCYQTGNASCGMGNDLLDNGGYYWFSAVRTGANIFFWRDADYHYAYQTTSDLFYGLRPVIKLAPTVEIIGGSGTYQDPYTIRNEADKKISTNDPDLDDGNLIPVYYDETAEVWKKADSTNPNNIWYDYGEKKWANAVMISDSTKRSTYQSATAGTTIVYTDISGFLVWIPRFKYRVWNINRQGGAKDQSTYVYPAYSEGIDIKFETGIRTSGNVKCTYNISTAESETNLSDTCVYNGTDTITTDSNNLNYTNAWYTHPAFTFGGVEKTGFWIGKFETTGSAESPTILPDTVSLLLTRTAERFTSSKVFQNYGLSSDVDAHMLTNLEWGAVAYLTHSMYGLCDENECRDVYYNNTKGKVVTSNKEYYTGRSSGVLGSFSSSSDYGNYDYKGYLLDTDGNKTSEKDITKVASTTGNITGVYDMVGGAWDDVMANMVDSSGAFQTGDATSDGVNWNGSDTLDIKYYNAYSYGTSSDDQKAYNRARLGDATAEITLISFGGWKPGYSISGAQENFMAGADYVWFIRGGIGGIGNSTSSSFSYTGWAGAGNAYGFRLSIS